MSIQQTGKSQPGGGKRSQGVQLPDADTVARRIGKDTIDDLVDERHPGLREVLSTLSAFLGSGRAVATIPGDHIHQAARSGHKDLDAVPTLITVEASSARAVSVLHLILALGVDAYLNDDSSLCWYCDEPVHYRLTYGGDDVVWFHRPTGKTLCADGENAALRRRRPRRSAG